MKCSTVSKNYPQDLIRSQPYSIVKLDTSQGLCHLSQSYVLTICPCDELWLEEMQKKSSSQYITNEIFVFSCLSFGDQKKIWCITSLSFIRNIWKYIRLDSQETYHDEILGSSWDYIPKETYHDVTNKITGPTNRIRCLHKRNIWWKRFIRVFVSYLESVDARLSKEKCKLSAIFPKCDLEGVWPRGLCHVHEEIVNCTK